MRQITIARAIPGSTISDPDYFAIDNLVDKTIFFTIVETDSFKGRTGWFFSEEKEPGILHVYRSLPQGATIQEVLQVLQSIKSGQIGPKTQLPQSGPGQPENVLVDLNSDGGEYKGLFPVIRIANAPAWLVNILNTITGKGTLSLIVWITITTIIGSKMAMNKHRSPVCWMILGTCLLMTYDSYRYKQSKSKQ